MMDDGKQSVGQVIGKAVLREGRVSGLENDG